MKAWLLAVFALLLTGCVDHLDSPVSVASPGPTSIADLSASTVQTDGMVTFTARLHASANPQRTGAYAARVEYDPSVITYVGEGAASSGMVAFHAKSGVLRVAGTSLDGYKSGVLFNARFRVARIPRGAELKLVIDELRGIDLVDRLPNQLTARTALLRPWK